MKRVIALSFAAAALAGTPALADMSLAGDISLDTTPIQSSTTRAEVRASIGRMADTEWARQRANPFEATGYTRQAARADYLKYRSEIGMMTGEDSGSHYLKQGAASTGTRAMGAGPR